DATTFVSATNMPPSDYPYVEQDRTTEDVYAAVWCLKEIDLPSGGKIKVTYESDDYAYVQNKKAGQMFKIINYVKDQTDLNALTGATVDKSNTLIDFSQSISPGFFIFRANQSITDFKYYKDNLKYVNFRFLINIKTTNG